VELIGKLSNLGINDVEAASLILTMEKVLRDELQVEFPDAAYKIFTLKGFVEQTDGKNSTGLDVGNPFMPPPLRKQAGIILGKLGYYRYIQNYMKIMDIIKMYVRRLIEIMYLLENEKRS